MDRIADHLHRIFLATALIALALIALPAPVFMVAGAAAAEPATHAGTTEIPLFPVVPPRAGVSPRFADLATALIVRWEIGSASQYARKYAGVYWPGGASGPTWGIGYDGGHQSAAAIERDWADHPSKAALAQTAGVTGQRAKLSIARWRGITTPYSYSLNVFADRSLPAYTLQARRALGQSFELIPDPAQAALVSLGYNRGWSMLGTRNAEKRAIRDQCLPHRDTGCIAQQLRQMCRIWEGTANGAGLCNRRIDEAKTAVRA